MRKKLTLNSNMVKPEKCDHLQLVYLFTIPLLKKKQPFLKSKNMNSEKRFHEYVVAKYSAEIRPIMNRFFADLSFIF